VLTGQQLANRGSTKGFAAPNNGGGSAQQTAIPAMVIRIGVPGVGPLRELTPRRDPADVIDESPANIDSVASLPMLQDLPNAAEPIELSGPFAQASSTLRVGDRDGPTRHRGSIPVELASLPPGGPNAVHLRWAGRLGASVIMVTCVWSTGAAARLRGAYGSAALTCASSHVLTHGCGAT
jgi:hypothetical protein